MEVNTAYSNTLTPPDSVLQKYYDLGGRLLTLGSDAHRSVNVAKDFDLAIERIKKIGFESYCYYENRKPVFVSI